VLTLLVLALGFCLIAAFLCAVAVGIGFLLAACIPSLQLGHGIIAGAIVAVATLYFLRRLLKAAANYPDDDEGIPDDHPVIVLPKDFLHRGPRKSKPKGKRK
jgi:membrane protein implicated in regulation of membrane protease activity